MILCTGNSCRSQMAEGILRHYGADKFEVFSAGSSPPRPTRSSDESRLGPSQVNPIAIEVMKEIGIDISHHRSKHLNEFLSQPFDFVITVCDSANETCPIFPGEYQKLHWPFPDPPHDEDVSPLVIKEFRKVRDMILGKFRVFGEKGNP